MKKFKSGKLNIRSLFLENWIILVFAIIFILTIISVTKIIAKEIGNNGDESKYTIKENINLSIEEYDTLNPFLSRSKDVFYFDKLLYGSLFKIGENMTPELDLASSYTADSEKGQITITLKDDLKFAGGQELRAKDVLFTINTIKQCEKSYYYDMVKKITNCALDDNLTLTITFANPDNCNLFDLTFPIISSSEYKNSVEFLSASGLDFVPNGVGAYSVQSIDDKNIYLKATAEGLNIVCSVLPTASQKMNLALIDEITCYVTDDSLSISKAVNTGLKEIQYPSNKIEFIKLNVNGSDEETGREFRKALLYAINMDQLRDSAYMNTGISTNSLVLPGFMGIQKADDPYKYNRAKSKEMLAGLGYADLNGDGYLEDGSGKRVELSIVLEDGNNVRMLAANSVKKYLEQVGIYANITKYSSDYMKNVLCSEDYSILISGYSFGMSYGFTGFVSGKAPYYCFDENSFAEAKKLNQLHSLEEYETIANALQTELIEGAVYYPICYGTFSLITNDTFECEGGISLFNIYSNISSWKWYKKE